MSRISTPGTGPRSSTLPTPSSSVNIPFVLPHLDEDKRFKSTELIDASATALLDEVQRWTESLAALRKK